MAQDTTMETQIIGDLAAPTTDLRERYLELDELGVGASGRVTRSWDRKLRRQVARKALLSGKGAQRPMLLQEARLLAWLDHPGAVPVYDIDAGDEGASYTMRVLDGQTLRERMESEGQLGVQESVRILRRIGETMANAHAKGVLHLDLKPANLMLMPFGHVCILDWGVARFHDLDAYRRYLHRFGEEESPVEAGYTTSEGYAGTPAYMPVEQAVGENVGPASDIFAAGTMLYEMLVGRLPFEINKGKSVFAKLRGNVPALNTYRADIPERLDALCMRMLSPIVSDRPHDFTQVLAELDALYSVDIAQERQLQAGEVLFREGETGVEAYQILEGVVAITVEGTSGPTEIARRTVGDLIGEMAVVLEAPRSATVTAVEATRVAVVTGEVITAAMEGSNPLLARMLRSLSARLRQAADRVKRS